MASRCGLDFFGPSWTVTGGNGGIRQLNEIMHLAPQCHENYHRQS